MQSTLRGADVVARTLARAGVDRLFALSGNHIMSIFDATLDAGVEIVHVRHEGAAVHMADAWARLTGKVGVALLTGGPGHANGVSALYTALASESPMVLLSGHAPLGQLGAGAFQEMPQAALAAPVTKASWTASSLAGLGEDIARAMRIAVSGRPGPVHVSLPTDLLDAVLEGDAEVIPEQSAFRGDEQTLPAAVAAEMMAVMSAAERPLTLAAPCAATAHADGMTTRLHDATGVPVVTMESPRGINDPSLGAFAEVLAEADCVLLLGKQPDFTLSFAKPPVFARTCRLLQIDPDTNALTRLSAAAAEYARLPLQFRADPRPAAAALADHSTGKHRNDAWRAEVGAAITFRPEAWTTARGARDDTLHPAQLCAAVQNVLDAHPEAVLVCDGGEFGQWAQACLRAERRVINGPAAAIGSALSFAIAARLANPRAPVIALLGDGTIGFHLAEFDTALRYGLPFIAVVGNDACWNAEYQIQLREYGPERLVGCELLAARYDRVAEALGGHGEYVTEAEALPMALSTALGSGLPACVNIALDRTPAPAIRR